MAVIEVKEILGQRTGKIDQTWHRSYRRVFRVTTDNQYTGALEVRQAIPVQLGNTYSLHDAAGTLMEFDNFAFATNIEATIQSDAEDDMSWWVSVDYSAWDPTEVPENPLSAPIKMDWGGNRFDRVVTATTPDDNGDVIAVVNSAGDYFDPPLTCDASRPVLKITRNEKRYNIFYAMQWADVVNKLDWEGFPAGCLKLLFPTASLEFNPICGWYWTVTYEMEVKEEGWKVSILDQGLRQWNGTAGKNYPCTDENGEDVTSPVLLDGNGGQLPIGADPVFGSFKVYREADFSALGISLSGAPGTTP